MSFVFDPLPRITLPVAGSDALFPVERIFCVGQNYASHAKEMGATTIGEGVPIFFMKPASCVTTKAHVPYPPATQNLHHEVELAIAFSSAENIFGCAVTLDMTRRDLQTQLKSQGRPWELGKVFENALPSSAITPGAPPASGGIKLWLNDELKQNGDLSDMIWKPDQLITILSSYIPIRAGDLLLTGTPSGVGAVQPGDRLRAVIDTIGELNVTIQRPNG